MQPQANNSPISARLDRLEARLETLIESRLAGWMTLGAPKNLIHELVLAMHSQLTTSQDGRAVAPNVYTIQVNPDKLPYWQADPELLQQVARDLSQAADEAAVFFVSSPVLHLAANGELSAQEVKVIASLRQDPISDTAAFQSHIDESGHSADNLPPNAFLIINGVSTYPLTQAVVNIGRRLDNHLMINDPRVSRSHAQLRAIRGRYTLFDLNSTGGTFVNGQRITQINLNPGDVISLAGVPLIYGQDSSAAASGEVDLPTHNAGSTKPLETRKVTKKLHR